MQNGNIVKHESLSSLEHEILRYCDRNVRSFESIKSAIVDRSHEEITRAINKLRSEGIIYVSDLYDEIVSIITLAQ